MFHMTESLNRVRKMNSYCFLLCTSIVFKEIKIISDTFLMADRVFFPLPFCRAFSKKSIPLGNPSVPGFVGVENPLFHFRITFIYRKNFK